MKLALLFFLTIPASAQIIGNAQPQVFEVSDIIPVADAQANCNFQTGLNAASAACADDSSYLNAVLARATIANPVKLVFDVSIGIAHPIMIPAASAVTLEGLGSQGTGVFVIGGSGITAICTSYSGVNSTCTSAFGTIPSQSGSLTIVHLGINGNRPNNSTNPSVLQCSPNWCFGVLALNLKYFDAEDVYLSDVSTYAFLTDNIGVQNYDHINVNAVSRAVNQDGIHMNGPFGTYSISNSTFLTGDDAVANNLPEGYGGNGGSGAISNCTFNGPSFYRAYNTVGTGTYVMGPVAMDGVTGTVTSSGGWFAILGADNGGDSIVDEIQAVKISNVDVYSLGYFIVVNSSNVGDLKLANVTLHPQRYDVPWLAWPNTNATTTLSNYICTACTIYRNPAANAASWWAMVPNYVTVKRYECDGCTVANETGQTYSALSYAVDVQPGGSIGTFVLSNMDPSLQPTLLNGNEWSRIGSFYGAGVSTYYRNTTYANLPPATYPGLKTSVSDSNAGGVWGAIESGGSPGHYAELGSNGTNWTVTGK